MPGTWWSSRGNNRRGVDIIRSMLPRCNQLSRDRHEVAPARARIQGRLAASPLARSVTIPEDVVGSEGPSGGRSKARKRVVVASDRAMVYAKGGPLGALRTKLSVGHRGVTAAHDRLPGSSTPRASTTYRGMKRWEPC